MPDLSCDVLVVGGGATGVCAAYDLARRGLRVILADMNDLTTGTSGRFHGLLHSGARYAVRDPESARECIDENRILRRIVPHIVEDTGGLFVAAAHDPADYAPQWVAGCAAAGIPAEEISITQLLQQEPALRSDIARAFRVPDGTVDGFDLGHAFSRAAESYGTQTLIYHRVDGLSYTADGMRVTLADLRGGTTRTVEARWVLNAAGPWAGQVAALAGADLHVRGSRGVMIAMNTRWVNTVINRLRPPDDGDILVPVGTVSVIGTSSVTVERPDDYTIDPREVTRMLDEGEAIIHGFRQARALRVWAGVRPLYEPPGQHEDADGRGVKRTFSVVRHSDGLTSVVGGKLTTARLMAEKAADDICAALGIDVSCTTADEVLPGQPERRYHQLGRRLEKLEHGQMTGSLICECEMVTRPQLEAAIASYDQPPALDDLRRDLRLGMGPCQGGFCAVRAASILRYARDLPASEAVDALRDFVAERFKGGRALLWGHHLRQFLLDELIYRRILGLDLCAGERQPEPFTLPGWAQAAEPLPAVEGRPRVVVIGAGLSGLMAAVHAARAGAQVQVLGSGLGRLLLTPGTLQLGAFAGHPGVSAFAEWLAGQEISSLRLANGGPHRLPTMLGIPQQVDRAPVTLAGGTLNDETATLIVGLSGWRDFDSALFAGMMTAAGSPARSIHVALPGRHDGWDLSPTELAHRFDDPDYRAEVARQVRGRMDGEGRVGFPAVLGLRDSGALADMEARLGVPVFEVPTLTPSVPGTRLFNAFKRWLLKHGARIQVGHPVTRAVIEDGRVTGVAVDSAGHETVFPADTVILATGGLYGGGLLSDDRGRVWEPLFDLPVQAAPDRSDWFRDDLLDLRGHPLHGYGVAVDELLRPLDAAGAPICGNLFAAGHVLGGFSPLVGGYDEGLDLASAYAAVRSALNAVR